MELRFVRKQGQRDTIYVRRGDGSTASWAFPGYGDGLPHDLVHLARASGSCIWLVHLARASGSCIWLVHLVVEIAFSVRDGFWAASMPA